MNNIYTNEINFRFNPVNTFGYTDRTKYAAGKISFDQKGNARFDCNNYSYCNYIELLNFLEKNFDTEYSYHNVKVAFYGKNTRSVRVGRTSIEVSYENKTCVNGEFFLPDMILALNIIKLYDAIEPYGFNKRFYFVNKTSKEILDFFEVKFTIYNLNKKSTKEQHGIPSADACWNRYVNEIQKTYSQWEWEHSHCESGNEYGYDEFDDKPLFGNVEYTFPIMFKVVGKHGTMVTEKYHREYEIIEIQAISLNYNKHIPTFVVYVPKDREKFPKVFTTPDFERYIRKECTFNSIEEAVTSFLKKLK